MMIASFLRGEIKTPSRLSWHLQDRAKQANELNLKLATSKILNLIHYVAVFNDRVYSNCHHDVRGVRQYKKVQLIMAV